MSKSFMIVLALAAVIAIAAFFFVADYGQSGSQVADADDPELVAMGKSVYAESCASCHGKNLEGQKNWRRPLPDGTLPAPPHDETGHTWHHPDQLLFDYTKLGGAGVLPPEAKSAMPAFKDSLTDQQIWAVLAFIKRSWPEKIRKRHQEMNERVSQSSR